jgi:hypothetical protein
LEPHVGILLAQDGHILREDIMKQAIFLKRCIFITLITGFTFTFSTVIAQENLFRSGIFLHHSTGGCIWGPNGSATSVPQEIDAYNLRHGYTGLFVVSLNEEEWPLDPWDNEWSHWHNIFDNNDPTSDIGPFLAANKIIMIKSCFPSSDLWSEGEPSDTTDPTSKTILNYKWHWRSFIQVMQDHPANFFVVWTNAPQERESTSDESALLSDQFCRWAKDTLAAGLDPVYGAFPNNVYIFDFFHHLAGSDGKLPDIYRTDSGNSHPNDAATAHVAPLLVEEIFNAAIAYESTLGLDMGSDRTPLQFVLEQNYPNPFNPSTTIRYSIPEASFVTLKIYNTLGQEVAQLVSEQRSPGTYIEKWDATGFVSGVYYYQLQTGSYSQTKKLILLK